MAADRCVGGTGGVEPGGWHTEILVKMKIREEADGRVQEKSFAMRLVPAWGAGVARDA